MNFFLFNHSNKCYKLAYDWVLANIPLQSDVNFQVQILQKCFKK